VSLALFKGQPRGLAVCFSTELWERFSYYGMRALLVLFLTKHFLFDDSRSYLIYGAYTAMVYVMPVLGGAISDRYLGPRKAVTLGSILLVLGHFGMTIEGPPAIETMINGARTVTRDAFYVNVFYLSLALIITGVGFIKANISTVVGALYDRDDPRRDAGFTIFYMGINIGGAAAPLLCGWLGQTYGWRYGFGLAGIGMLAGLFGFLWGQRRLMGHADPPDAAHLRERVVAGLSREALVYLASLGLVVGVWLIMQRQTLVGPMLSVFGMAVAMWILYYATARCTPDERKSLLACATLILFTIGFWAFYEQMGSSLNLFADRMVNRVVIGREIPSSMFQSLPSVFVILLAPFFSALWLSLGRRGLEPSTPVKFSLAIAQLALAFLVLAFGTTLVHGHGKVALIWYVLNFFLLVTGELCLAPVGMAMVTTLAPARIVGIMMGTFFLAYSASSFISGLIAQLTSVQTAGGAVVDRTAALATYAGVYTRLGLTALAVASLLYLLSPLLKRYMRGARTPFQGRIVAENSISTRGEPG
jgi:POT family proton-dependent oligopeptide transporter